MSGREEAGFRRAAPGSASFPAYYSVEEFFFPVVFTSQDIMTLLSSALACSLAVRSGHCSAISVAAIVVPALAACGA